MFKREHLGLTTLTNDLLGECGQEEKSSHWHPGAGLVRSARCWHSPVGNEPPCQTSTSDRAALWPWWVSEDKNMAIPSLSLSVDLFLAHVSDGCLSADCGDRLVLAPSGDRFIKFPVTELPLLPSSTQFRATLHFYEPSPKVANTSPNSINLS